MDSTVQIIPGLEAQGMHIRMIQHYLTPQPPKWITIHRFIVTRQRSLNFESFETHLSIISIDNINILELFDWTGETCGGLFMCVVEGVVNRFCPSWNAAKKNVCRLCWPKIGSSLETMRTWNDRPGRTGFNDAHGVYPLKFNMVHLKMVTWKMRFPLDFPAFSGSI